MGTFASAIGHKTENLRSRSTKTNGRQGEEWSITVCRTIAGFEKLLEAFLGARTITGEEADPSGETPKERTELSRCRKGNGGCRN